MEQELIKELNEQIIVSFAGTSKILGDRIISLEKIIENKNTDKKLKNNIEIVLKDLKKAKDNIDDEIERMQNHDDKDKTVFYVEDSKYSDELTSSIEKNATIDEKIKEDTDKKEKIQEREKERVKEKVKDETDSSRLGKTVASVNESLDKRITKLRTKQGKIKDKQRKIVNKATEQKLREYLGRINIKDIERQKKIEEKIAKRDEEIEKLNTERAGLGEIKGDLLGSKSLISKGLGIKVAFNEKLTQARINRLKAKRGILKFRSRHMIQANVNKNLIARMKDKVVKFGKALGESIKSGIAGFKETYEEYMNDGSYTSDAYRARS